MSLSHSETLTGVIERLTFHSEETGYTVARFKVPGERDLTTVVGRFANVQPGQTLKLEGFWQEHPKYGAQFQVEQYTETKPATLTGIEKYLGSGLIKGVGPVTAKRIVTHFGLDTLDIIETQIHRLIEVPGIGRKRVQKIQQTWAEQKSIKEVMIFLQSHGVSTTYAVKIFKQYREGAISIVTTNPYQLAIDIFGIGFITADTIAQNVGVSPWSKYRYQAGILHILGNAAEDGHCFLPLPELVNKAIELLTTKDLEHQTESDSVVQVVQELVEKDNLVVEVAEGDMPLVYKPTFFYSEKGLATLIKQRLQESDPIDLARIQSWIERFTKDRQIELSSQQHEAVATAAKARMMVLTGGPGCGKTFTTSTIVALWKAMGKSIALAAPTGRAAQRLGEMTGLEAKTLHRLLEFDPSTRGFKRNQDNPLPCDAIIVDETSMLDLFLAYSLFKAIPKEAQLLLVGDIDQLPSVGAGNVLRDIIASNQVPVVRLTKVFRQAAQSLIIRAAHDINHGKFPDLEPISDQPRTDCLWHTGGTEPEHGVQVAGELITQFVPKLGFNPSTDVQVLCPMTRGAVGTRNLNQVLQQLLNPPHSEKMEITSMGTVLREGDRVIQLKNDYNRGVFNGDLGRIVAIDPEEKEVTVAYPDNVATYDYADLNEISLAWAVTIHKSQGSEYPVVVLPLYTQHYIMLFRNLLYTGITRARKLVIVIGSKKALSIAVNQVRQQLRYTRLSERLLSQLPDSHEKHREQAFNSPQNYIL